MLPVRTLALDRPTGMELGPFAALGGEKYGEICA